jgi:ribulose-5-phosphate 4-epimerase/fuculose-1-phosphate aldolase
MNDLDIIERPVLTDIVAPKAERSVFDYPGPQPTVAEERLFRKQRLAASFRLFAKYGFDQGAAGHITARDPEWTDHFWVNPLAVYFGHIRVSDLLLVDHAGNVVQGNRPVNRAAFAIHSALHKARPDVVAAAHAHSLYGKAWASFGRRLDPLTQDSLFFYDDQALYSDYQGVVVTTDEGDRIAEALGDKRTVILQNHGHLTVGGSVEAAVWRYIAFEDAARVQLLVEQTGQKPHHVGEDVARFTRGQFDRGGQDNAWFSFVPLWDMITREQPDLFE